MMADLAALLFVAAMGFCLGYAVRGALAVAYEHRRVGGVEPDVPWRRG